jgi:hypothetical protein
VSYFGAAVYNGATINDFQFDEDGNVYLSRERAVDLGLVDDEDPSDPSLFVTTEYIEDEEAGDVEGEFTDLTNYGWNGRPYYFNGWTDESGEVYGG